MTTLTPNRILQQGDEYRNNGTWKAVPKEDYGLQVMFTKYAEVRRPDEEPPKTSSLICENPEAMTEFMRTIKPISPVSEKPKAVKPSAIVTATAEKEKSPAPTPSGAGEPHPSAYLPTIISKKAHEAEWIKEHVETHPTMAEHAPPAPEPLAQNGIIKIDFPKPDPTNVIEMCNQPVWTGRNGTFTGYGLEAMSLEGRINLCPIGKRGVGNCAIQFPKAIIPQLVDWLLRQQTTTPI